MQSSNMGEDQAGWSLVFLSVGALAGICLAIASILAPAAPLEPEIASSVVATVNGRPIQRALYERTSAGLASDLNRALTDQEGDRVLDRLIDEELLVQHGLALDLPEVDSLVRSTMVGVVIETVVAMAENASTGSDDLRRFYGENAEYFARPGRLAVRQIFFSAYEDEQGAKQRADQALARLQAGESFDLVVAELGDREIVPLPTGLISAETLRDILGPTALTAAMALKPGTRSGVVRSGSGFHVIELLERRALEVPPFETVEDAVAAEYRRRQGEAALRDTLERLRRRADLRFGKQGR